MSSTRPVTRLHLSLAAFVAVVTAVGIAWIPANANLPVHWSLGGAPDVFVPRNLALSLMPALLGALVILAWFAPRAASPAQVEAGTHIARAALTGLMLVFSAVHAGIVMIGLGIGVDMARVVVVGFALLLANVGNVMPKSRPNALAGLRLPWTLRDPAIWQAAHRIAGRLMVLSAVLLAVLAFLLPSTLALVIALFACVLIPPIAAGVVSYMLSRRTDPSHPR